jgi:SAM-dependent methyltransferase
MTSCKVCGGECGLALEDLATSQASKRASPLDWGSLRRLAPISQVWGLDRGLPIDRYYIHGFLERHRSDIRGRALEVKEPAYTYLYGEGVESSEVVDVATDNPLATLVADLGRPETLPASSYDCFVLTQTIHIIYDAAQVVANAHQALRPGGVLLASLPCVSRIDPEAGVESDFWRFTVASAKRLFEPVFGKDNLQITSFGNMLACMGFLLGVAAEELTPEELDSRDPAFPLIVCVRARKPD